MATRRNAPDDQTDTDSAERATSLASSWSSSSTRRSFAVRIERSNVLASGADITAHIKCAEGLQPILDENDVRLGDAVMDIISDILVEIVREEEGGG